VMKDFDPKHVGFHWDTGHMSHHGSNMWELLMRTAGPYVVAMAWKDRSWAQDLGLLGEGGPYPGPQAPAARAGAGRGGRGRGGAPAAGAPPGGPRAGGAPPAGGRGEGFAEGDGPPAGFGGRGAGPRAFPLALAGKAFARGGGWNSPYVPMGTGLVDVFRYATVLRDIGFNGPMELEAEYPMGGAENGNETITLPRAQVLGSMKRDVLTIRAAFEQSGTGLTI